MKLSTLLVSLVTLSVAGYVSSRIPPMERDVADVEGLPAAKPPFPAKEYLSNAERIRRGLPLNPPQRRSESLVARAPQPSSAPGNTGQVFAVFGDTSMSGYFSGTLDADGRYVITQDASQGVTVNVQGHQLVAMNGNSGFPEIGATFGEDFQALPTGPGNNAFDTNSYNFAAITGTSGGTYREAAHSGGTSYRPAPNNFIEPAIFTRDPGTGEITATWINPDLTPRPAAFGTSSTGGLFISGNIGMFNAMYGGVPVRLFLV